jgi:hypothetical protein
MQSSAVIKLTQYSKTGDRQMTRKDYIKIAEVFRNIKKLAKTQEEIAIVNTSIHDMADMLKDENPNFRHSIFFNAIDPKD